MSHFSPPWFLRSGLAMTMYVATIAKHRWQRSLLDPEPPYQSHLFTGKDQVPIHGLWTLPPVSRCKGTIIGTYGITGSLEDQWFLRILGRKAYGRGYAVLLFDWRAHGKTAELSPTLTSDGLNEGEDFVYLAAQAQALGCPAPFWFTGFSLGGQLALWGIHRAAKPPADLSIDAADIGGGAVICPSLDAERSLRYLTQHPIGRYMERAIAKNLNQLAWQIHETHPGSLDPEAIQRANSIWNFDHELVIPRLGFSTVEAYYRASSPLRLIPEFAKSTLIIYAADDPLFAPELSQELASICTQNALIDLLLTARGGHVGYISSYKCQIEYQDTDPWWAWNRVLDWIDTQS